jgi:predicted DNA-binding protein
VKKTRKKPIQIYIEADQDAVLERLASKKGVSKAALIRESVEKYLRDIPVEEDPALGLIGMADSGKSDLASRHDEYLSRYAARKNR